MYQQQQGIERTTELLQRDHTLVVLLVVVHDDLLVVAFTNNETRVTPTEVIHAPERVDRKEETVDRISGAQDPSGSRRPVKLMRHTTQCTPPSIPPT